MFHLKSARKNGRAGNLALQCIVATIVNLESPLLTRFESHLYSSVSEFVILLQQQRGKLAPDVSM